MDQTSFAAEFEAAMNIIQAAAKEQVPVRIWIDNKAVQQGIKERIEGSRPTEQEHVALWKDMENVIDKLPKGCTTQWVPSHNKRLEWEGPDFARELNDIVDKKATEQVKERFRREKKRAHDQEAKARKWCERHLLRLYNAGNQYKERWNKAINAARQASKESKKRKQQEKEGEEPGGKRKRSNMDDSQNNMDESQGDTQRTERIGQFYIGDHDERSSSGTDYEMTEEEA